MQANGAIRPVVLEIPCVGVLTVLRGGFREAEVHVAARGHIAVRGFAPRAGQCEPQVFQVARSGHDVRPVDLYLLLDETSEPSLDIRAGRRELGLDRVRTGPRTPAGAVGAGSWASSWSRVLISRRASELNLCGLSSTACRYASLLRLRGSWAVPGMDAPSIRTGITRTSRASAASISTRTRSAGLSRRLRPSSLAIASQCLPITASSTPHDPDGGPDLLGKVITGLNRVNVLEHPVRAEASRQQLEQPASRIGGIGAPVADEDPVARWRDSSRHDPCRSASTDRRHVSHASARSRVEIPKSAVAQASHRSSNSPRISGNPLQPSPSGMHNNRWGRLDGAPGIVRSSAMTGRRQAGRATTGHRVISVRAAAGLHDLGHAPAPTADGGWSANHVRRFLRRMAAGQEYCWPAGGRCDSVDASVVCFAAGGDDVLTSGPGGLRVLAEAAGIQASLIPSGRLPEPVLLAGISAATVPA